MNRRTFISLLGSAAMLPVAARAQEPDRVRRLAVLIGGSENDPTWQRYEAAFRDGLAKLGWIEGTNLRIELAFVADDLTRARTAAAELVGHAPDVIFVSSGTATRAMEQQTRTIPIVFAGPGVAVVKNDAHPEGNLTGFPILYPSVAGKWVDLFKKADPRIVRIGLVNNPIPTAAGLTGSSYVSAIEEVAPALAVKVIATSFRNAVELKSAVEAFAAKPNGGLVVIPSSFTSTRDSRNSLRELAAKHRLPTIHWDKSYPAEGGLMSYGSNYEELHRRAASYVDRILRGAKVSELPVERPTMFELAINLKTAKALSLTIPPSLLAIADEVIE